MTISENEAAKLIDTILAAISKRDPQPGRDAIADLLAQWHSEIDMGRPTDRRLRVRENPNSDGTVGTSGSGPASTGEFVGKKEFPKVEQLDMLLEVLGLAFVVPHLMAGRIIDTVGLDSSIGTSGTPVSIAMAPVGDVGGPTRRIDKGLIGRDTEATARLTRLIEELSKEIGLRDRPIAWYDLSI